MGSQNLSRGARNLSSFRTRMEALEDRRCLAVSVVSIGSELRITGDGDDDTINISDSGDGSITVTDGGGATLGTGSGVARIRVNANGGSDTVNYTLAGELTTGRSLSFNLGDGDTNRANLDFSAGIAANLRVNVAGGDGDDTVDVTLGAINDADVDVDVDGEDGEDHLSVTQTAGAVADGVAGSASSSLHVSVDGGDDNDTLNASLVAGSDVSVNVGLHGGAGDDDATLGITGDEAGGVETTVQIPRFGGRNLFATRYPAGVHADLDGGWGDDTLSASVDGAASEYTKIEMNGGNGDDELSLSLGAGALPLNATASAKNGLRLGINGDAGMHASMYGGSGDDTMNATLGALAAGRNSVDMDGGSGDDEMSLVATAVDIAVDASLSAKMNGGSGDDVMNALFEGEILGSLKFEANGGGGDDSITSNLTAAIGSSGSLVAKSGGDSGTDDVTLNVFDLSGNGGASLLAKLDARIFDPGGHDNLVNTDLVDVILNNGHRNGNDGNSGFGGIFERVDDFLENLFGAIGRRGRS